MPPVRSVRVIGVVVGLTGALTACQHGTTSATAPSTSTTATSTSFTMAAPTTSAATTTPETTAATTAAVALTTPAAPARTASALVLGPTGLGALKMGMSRSQAEATGLIKPFYSYEESDRCHWRSKLTKAPAGNDNDFSNGTVFYSTTFGVATIDAYPGVHTPEGIGIGSSLAAVTRAYPGFRTNPVERSGVLVPGHSALAYRIAYSGGKVTELTLQYAHQDCYE